MSQLGPMFWAASAAICDFGATLAPSHSRYAASATTCWHPRVEALWSSCYVDDVPQLFGSSRWMFHRARAARQDIDPGVRRVAQG